MLAPLITVVVPRYIDPGAGSLLFQAAVGAVMATTLTVKVYWRRLRTIFGRTGDVEATPNKADD